MKKIILTVFTIFLLQMTCCSDPEENPFVLTDEPVIENDLDSTQIISNFEEKEI